MKLHLANRTGVVLSRMVAAIVLVAVLVSGAAASIDDDIRLLQRTGKAFAAITEKANRAVVFVQIEKTVGRRGPLMGNDPLGFFNDPFFRRFFGPGMPRRQPQEQRQVGQGSGFIFHEDGYILTNNHVVGDADVIKVKLADGRRFTAKVVGTDPQSDVAVIKIDADNLPVLPLGDSDKLQVGEWVIAIGNPFGLHHSVTVGVVSAKGRSHLGINDYEDFIQTDAAINPGNSGGPLINIHGEAVGMNTAIFSRSGGSMGIGFAIPINMARAVSDQLIDKGKVTRGRLGVVIQEIDEELAKSFGLDSSAGVLVAEVADDSPAEKGGMKSGDVIVSMNGKPVDDVGELRNSIALTRPGTKMTFTVIRDGHRKKLVVTIGSQESGGRLASVKSGLLKKLGLEIQDLTPELAAQFGYSEGDGVLVAEVEPGSMVAQVGLRSGILIEEVNRKKVHNTKEFMKALARSKKTGRVMFKIRDGEYSRFVAFRID